MNDNELKQAIAADIKALKKMENYPIDLRCYQRMRRKWVFRLFCLVWLTYFGITFVQACFSHPNICCVGLNDWLFYGFSASIMASLYTGLSFPIAQHVAFFKVQFKYSLELGEMIWKRMVAFGWIMYGVFIGLSLIHSYHHGQSTWLAFTIDLIALGVFTFILSIAFNYTLGLFAREGLFHAIVNCCRKNKTLSIKKRSVLT